MRRKIFLLVLLSLTLVFFSSCETKSAGDTSSQSKLDEKDLTAKATVTVLPTETPIPTDTPVPTVTPTPTDTPTPTLSPTPFANIRFTRQAEDLDRGLVAVSCDTGIFLSWRYLGTDSKDASFLIYRNGEKITAEPITGATNYIDANGTAGDTYSVVTVNSNEGMTENAVSDEAIAYATSYFDIPLDVPEDDVYVKNKRTGETVVSSYTPNDCSVGDVDGDGEYEIILKWEPSNSKDNSQNGITGKTYIDCYKLDGTKLWRIDMGRSIRSGAHYTQFMVYDFDGDGKAELIMKTSDGTVDGTGNVIGDGTKMYMNASGVILWGNEYLTLFDGETGAALDTIDFEPARDKIDSWGDNYANRSERYLAAVAYFNGVTPSCVMSRGYYARTAIACYDVVDKKLVMRWKFDTNDEGNSAYTGQGNHNLAVADVDGDGYDELCFGQLTMDHDGTVLVCTGLGHGDAMHVGDLVLSHPGLEAWGCLEGSHGAVLWNPGDAEILLRQTADNDTGRGTTGNFIAGNDSYEFVSSLSSNIYDADGNVVGTWPSQSSVNYAIYWDADLEHEIQDGNKIYDLSGNQLIDSSGTTSNNGTKRNSSLTGDIIGDWREELIVPTSDGTALRVFTTTDLTDVRLFTLMHDTQYRCQIAAQNVAYNQGALTSFFLGTGFDLPAQPDIYLATCLN